MASVSVILPTPLRRFAGGAGEVAAEGVTVGEVLGSLARDHVELGRRLLGESDTPRRFIRLLLNDVDVSRLEGLDTTVAAGDRLAVVIPIAGG